MAIASSSSEGRIDLRMVAATGHYSGPLEFHPVVVQTSREVNHALWKRLHRHQLKTCSDELHKAQYGQVLRVEQDARLYRSN